MSGKKVSIAPNHSQEKSIFVKRLGEMRPALHRYCARMAGSVIDGEDIVQETMIKAVDAYDCDTIENSENWIFRIAHNTALDFLRRRKRLEMLHVDEDPDVMADESPSAAERYAATANMRIFMHLPVAQRGVVIMVDVLGYSLQEVSAVTSLTVPAVKAALHRGRIRLREMARRPDDAAFPPLDNAELDRLAEYADRFNAHDFDGIRNMLADDVKLELVNRKRMQGRREVSQYFGNYAGVGHWAFETGWVDGKAVLLVMDSTRSQVLPSYFVMLEWREDKIIGIRDFRYAAYVVKEADIARLPGTGDFT